MFWNIEGEIERKRNSGGGQDKRKKKLKIAENAKSKG